jgi:predicted nuclease with RNAse H fold
LAFVGHEVEVIGRLMPRATMRTVGVDLSSSSKRTAVVAVEWGKERAIVGEPVLGLDDGELVQRLASAGWVGIDAPFGWPMGAARAVHEYAVSGRWSGEDKDDFRFRRTDMFVRDVILAETGRKLSPLSVSSDRIALTARRTAVLREHAYERSGVRFDLAGGDQVVEVYPAAALLVWGFDRGGYKSSRRVDRREAECRAREVLLGAIESRVGWLSWAEGSRSACVESDDALDAVLAALIARAAALGLTILPPAEDVEPAHSEGWIHLPQKDSLAALMPPV